MNKSFSIKEALQFGWQTTLKNFWFWAGILLIMFAIRWLGAVIQAGMMRQASGLASLVGLIFGLAAVMVQMGAMKIALEFIDGQAPAYSDLWTHLDTRQILHFILAAFLIGCGVAAGIILLVIPGIFWALSWCFTGYVVIDKKATAMAAMKESWHMATGVRWSLLGLFIILAVVNVLGILLFGIGLFWTMPTSLVAGAWVYRKLSGAIAPEAKTEVVVPAAPLVPAADIS